jgi:cell wall-associated NlpC family hydrolase
VKTKEFNNAQAGTPVPPEKRIKAESIGGTGVPACVNRPVFSDPSRASALLRELDSWLGTPWAHMANRPGKQLAIKGNGGDCVTIILTALYNVGALEPLDLPAHVAAPGISAENEVAHSITKFVKPFIDAGRLIQIRGAQAGTPVPPENSRKRNSASGTGVTAGELMVGDLLTFKLGGARDHHLGICISPVSRFYHCPGPGHRFMVSHLSQFGTRFQSAFRLMERTT